MMPYKFIDVNTFIKDMLSDNKEFEILRKAYLADIIRVVRDSLIIVADGTICRVDPTDYILLQENGKFAVLEESDIES